MVNRHIGQYIEEITKSISAFGVGDRSCYLKTLIFARNFSTLKACVHKTLINLLFYSLQVGIYSKILKSKLLLRKINKFARKLSA